jgi:hypothetical protein
MIAKRVLVLLLVAAVLGGCSAERTTKEAEALVDASMAIDIQIDEEANFPGYTTWMYLPAQQGMQGATADQNLQRFGDDVRAALDKEMFTRGYRKVKESPDLLVNLYGAVEGITEAYIEEHYQGHYTPDYDLVLPDSKDGKGRWMEGTVFIFVFDAKTKQVVYYASAQAEANPSMTSDAQKEARAISAVTQMMAQFPTKGK